jgi:integrase
MPKRRANHEGTIYKRQDGRWVASITLPGGKRKSFYGQTRQEVAQKLTVGLKARLDGVPLPSEQLKVGQYLQDWLQSTQPSIRPSTWRRYEQLLRLYAIPTLGTLPLTRLEPRHVQRLYADCLAQGLAPATVRQLHAVLRRALGQATKWGTVARNVVALVTPPRVKRHEIQPLSVTQARALLDVAKGERLEALYVLALTSGMRLGELLGLRWRDVDLDAGTLQVRQILVRMPSGLRFGEPKTKRSRRRIALSAGARDALRHHRARQAAERLRLGPVWEDHDLVFANEIGKPLDAGNLLRRDYWRALAKAGIPRCRFHDLRHTCATLLLQQGVHAKVVSELLGHSSIGMTLDIYSHVIPDMQQHAVSAMDAVLRG